MTNYLSGMVLGYDPANIFFHTNATKTNFEALFGSRTDHKGKLYWKTRRDSEVFIYYSGHGHSLRDSNPGEPGPCQANARRPREGRMRRPSAVSRCHPRRSIRRAKKALKLAFQTQLRGLGFSMVEIISTCCTNWRMGPIEALEWAEKNMVPYYPLGDTKVSDGTRALMEEK